MFMIIQYHGFLTAFFNNQRVRFMNSTCEILFSQKDRVVKPITMSVKLINLIHMQKSHGFPPMCITKVTFASITSWSLLQCFHLFLFRDPKSTLFRLAHRSHLTPHTGQPWRKATGHKASTSETSIIDLKKTNQLRLLLIPPNHTKKITHEIQKWNFCFFQIDRCTFPNKKFAPVPVLKKNTAYPPHWICWWSPKEKTQETFA